MVTEKGLIEHGEPHLTIGFFRCWIHTRPFENAESAFDNDWLTASTVYDNNQLSLFDNGNYIQISSLKSFLVECKKLYERLSGKATLSSYEPNVHIEITAKNQGHIEIQFKFEPQVNMHIMVIDEIDQSYLPEIIMHIEKIINSCAQHENNRATPYGGA